MADCSYSRCIQQRRNIRRELQRWTKNMVHIVGLERIAEELMGRRKWKLYQESMSRNYLQPLNNNIKTRLNEGSHKDQIHPTTEDRLDLKSASESQQRQSDTNGIDGRGPTKENTKEENERLREAEDRLKDWSPENKCYFCVDGKLDSEHSTHGVLSPQQSDSDSTDSHSDSEVPPTLTPSTPVASLLSNNHRSAVINNNMTTIESVASMATLAAVAALSGNPAGSPAAPHLPFYAPGLIPPNWYIANVARNFQHTERLAEVEKTSGEQPLDLSCSKGGATVNNSLENKVLPNIKMPVLDTKHIFNSDFRAKPRMSAAAGRRTYTEDELQAALRDIQSGKLGTRRAAVIYGIPRSTLRNKVYKLTSERERQSHLNPSTPLKLDEEEAMDDDKELSGAEEEKEVEKALQAPLLSMADILRFSNMDNPEALKSLFQKDKEGQDLWSGLEHSAVGPYIQNFLFGSGNLLAAHKAPESDVNPMLPEFVKRMLVQDQLLKEQQRNQQNNGDNERLARPSPSNSVIMKSDKPKSESDMETEESPSNVILKIPSFKPTTSKNGCDMFRSSESGNIVSPPVTSDSSSPPILPGKGMTIKDVKDVIAQSISQKFQQNLEPARRPIMELDFKRGGFTPPLGGISVIKTQPEITRPYQTPQKPQQNTGSGTTQGGKGTRPKRGKYRNYDRDSLVEAVRAVQRGEMSVHRAGSYYGVPHSTLEYKVKERHLMRPRKRDPKPNPVDEKLAAIKQNEMRNVPDKMKPVMKPPQKFPPTSPNGMKIPIFDPNMPPLGGYNPPPPFPFWTHPGFHHIPMEYGRNPSTSFPPNHPEFFAASQMMQKLQEESSRTTQPSVPNAAPALAKSARQMAESLLDGTNTNGSFLDGIIRSSLESGVPSSEDKEDKNVAPENMSNKALLDQLCRNSRLTPLPKPNIADSGDEAINKKSGSPFNEETFISRRCTPPNMYDQDNSSFHTIELSNDSNASGERRMEEERKSPPPARIYLKQELTKPENLKPEMLVRFRDVLTDVDRNGTGESVTGSASESDAAQD